MENFKQSLETATAGNGPDNVPGLAAIAIDANGTFSHSILFRSSCVSAVPTQMYRITEFKFS
jgi:hypothetical protein